MPLYEYVHKSTGNHTVVSRPSHKSFMDHLVSLGPYRRVFSFFTAQPFAAVPPDDPRAPAVTSRAKYRSHLSKLSDEHSQRHGFEVNYQPVDLRNPREVGVSEAGIDRRNSSTP